MVNYLNNEEKKIWIVTPVYLDVISFLKLRSRILELLPNSVRFLVVDDTAGLDSEIQELIDLKDVRLIVPPYNLGHQRAIVYGLRTIAPDILDQDIIITLDSDGEDQPSDIPILLTRLLTKTENLRKVVLAQRTKRNESLQFRVMYFFFKIFFWTLTGLLIRTGNFAAYRGWFAKNLLSHPYFDLCYSSSFLGLNLPIEYVPCARGSRLAGQSRMNSVKLVMHGIRMLMPFMDRIAVRAMISFSVLAGSSAMGLLGYGCYRFMLHRLVDAWVVIAGGLCGVVSIIAIGNFMILFTLFSQSQSYSLKGIDRRSSQKPTSKIHSADAA